MIIKLELKYGHKHRNDVYQEDIQKHIDFLESIKSYDVSFEWQISDIISIMEGIKRELPKQE